MPKPTSALLTNAINFAKSQPQIAALINKRDNDPNLDCHLVKCEIKYFDQSDKYAFYIEFNYNLYKGGQINGEDIFVTLGFQDGEYVLKDFFTK